MNGGCWFAELCLIFGGGSSGGLFDRLAKYMEVALDCGVELASEDDREGINSHNW